MKKVPFLFLIVFFCLSAIRADKTPFDTLGNARMLLKRNLVYFEAINLYHQDSVNFLRSIKTSESMLGVFPVFSEYDMKLELKVKETAILDSNFILIEWLWPVRNYSKFNDSIIALRDRTFGKNLGNMIVEKQGQKIYFVSGPCFLDRVPAYLLRINNYEDAKEMLELIYFNRKPDGITVLPANGDFSNGFQFEFYTVSDLNKLTGNAKILDGLWYFDLFEK